jgi:hypothetical protein
MHRLRRRPASRTLFCGGFGRRFFIYIVYIVFGGRSKVEHLIRFATEKSPSILVFPRQTAGHATCHHCVDHPHDVFTPQTRKRGDK